MDNSHSEYILKVDSLCQAYGTHQVLKNLSFSLGKGEILGIIGENGAGKSTLVKSILGMLKPTSGTINLTTSAVAIHQELNLANDLPIYANFYLGREITKAGGLLDIKKMAGNVKKALEELSVHLNPYDLTETLSVSEKQMLEIAKALDFNSGLLILDEPSALLNTGETDLLFKIMRRLKANGTSMIYISHKLDEIRDNCDNVAILRDGELAGAGKASELTPREMAEMMVGRPLSDIYPKVSCTFREAALTFSSPVLGSFSLRKGEILGVAGLADSGQIELGETIAAFRREREAEIGINGKIVNLKTPRDARKHGIGYLTSDRLANGVWKEFTIKTNIALGSIDSCADGAFISKSKTAALADKYKNEFHIRCQSIEDETGALSGGNQQKVSMAKVLADNPSVVILNEPTQGVDVGARQEIYTTIGKLADAGLAILLVSSDLTEILGLCKRVIVMREGRIAGELAGGDITEKAIIRIATGT